MYEESLVGPWFRRDGISVPYWRSRVDSSYGVLLVVIAVPLNAERRWEQYVRSRVRGEGHLPGGSASQPLSGFCAISLLNLIFFLLLLLLLFFPLFSPGDDSDRKSEVWAAPCEAASSSFLFSCYLLHAWLETQPAWGEKRTRWPRKMLLVVW